MKDCVIEVKEWFDGTEFHSGAHQIEIRDGRYFRISEERISETAEKYDFIMPSMSDAHCHLFLDGDELDAEKRKGHLDGGFDLFLATGRANLHKYHQAGVRVIRDAGDIHGVNTCLKDTAREMGMSIISAGKAIRKAKRYGSFMAIEVDGNGNIAEAVANVAASSDCLKIILSGIIDFAKGQMKGAPQFDQYELNLMVRLAKDHGLRTFVHCSGLDGLELAVRANVDSIEHGFFMNREILEQMAAKEIAWVPTFIPVQFQYENPGYGNWDSAALDRIKSILDNHAECLNAAHRLGVQIMAGSDGGSFGVRQGSGLLDELDLMRKAGLPDAAVLHSATIAPRRHFGLESNHISVGHKADFIDFNPLKARR